MNLYLTNIHDNPHLTDTVHDPRSGKSLLSSGFVVHQVPFRMLGRFHFTPQAGLTAHFYYTIIIFSHVCGNVSFVTAFKIFFFPFALSSLPFSSCCMACGKITRYTHFFKETEEKEYMSLFVYRRQGVLSVAHACVCY